MPDPVGLRLQSLTQQEQVLAIARLVEGEVRRFDASSLKDLFDELGLPRPSNIHAVLRSLRQSGDVTQLPNGDHRLTPRGRARSIDGMDHMDTTVLRAEVQGAGRPELANLHQLVLPPHLAPPELVGPLRAFLEEHPFESNVFLMTRFPDEELDDPVEDAVDTAVEACHSHGLELHMASHRSIHDDLWTNVAGHMWASRYGIALLEDRQNEGLSYNLTIEVGGMLMAGRRCALLKDRTIETLPTDLVGRIYKPIDLNDLDSVAEAIHEWLRDDLGLGACQDCDVGE